MESGKPAGTSSAHHFQSKKQDYDITALESYQALSSLFEKVQTEENDALLSCFFFNPDVNLYWPLFRLGNYKFKHLVEGPLAPLIHKERLGFSPSNKNQIFEDSRKETNLTKQILDSEPFVIREEVLSFIRLNCQIEKERILTQIGFRSQENKEYLGNIAKEFEVLLDRFAVQLGEFGRMPIVRPHRAMRLRNVTSRVLSEFVGTMVTTPTKTDSDLDWPYIIRTFDELFPESDLVVRQIYRTKKNGSLTLVDGDANPINLDGERIEAGIVEYVSRTAYPVWIRNISEYTSSQESNPSKSRPKFIPCKTNIGSEIAYPIIYGNKILGVLNIESNKEDAFTNEDIFVLHHLSAVIATKIKAENFGGDLFACTRFVNSSATHIEPESVFKLAREYIVTRMGYFDASIWYTKTKKWEAHGQNHGELIREGGLTEEIIQNKHPLIVCDYEGLGKHTHVLRGDLNLENIFTSWAVGDPIHIKNGPNKNIDQILAGASAAKHICDIGFPIFKYPNKREDNEVEAVIWIKCRQSFVSLVGDDFWFISLICRRITDSLQRLRHANRKALQTKKQIEKKKITWHFGEEAANKIMAHPCEDKKFLMSRKADDLIILNMDIRNSTDFYFRCSQTGDIEKIPWFMTRYYELVRDTIIKHNGIFDRFVGDGFSAIFNVYDSGISDYLSLKKSRRKQLEEISKRNSIAAALEICERFQGLVADFKAEFQDVLSDYEYVRIGGALVFSGTRNTCFLGSLSPLGEFFQYTVSGDAANTAGKFASYARMSVLRSLESKDPDQFTQRSSCKASIHEMGSVERDLIFCSARFKKEELEKHKIRGVISVNVPQKYSKTIIGSGCSMVLV